MQALWNVVLFTMLLSMSFNGMRISASLDALAHGGNATVVGILIGIISFVPMLTALPFGRWVDRTGAVKPVLLGGVLLLCSGLASFAFPAARFGIWPLVVSCVLGGAGWMAVQMTTQQIVGVLSDAPHRATWFSRYSVGLSVSGLISPVLAGAVIDHFGHHWSFLVVGLYALIGMAILLLRLQGIPREWSGKPRGAKKHPAFELMKIPRVRNMLIVSSISAAGWDLQNFMFPVYGHAVNLTASDIGLLVGTFYAATLVVRFVVPWTLHWMTMWQFITVAMVFTAASYLAFPLFSTLAPLMACAVLLGMGLGGNQPIVMNLLHQQTPQGRVGEAIGLRVVLQKAAHVALPPLFGLLAAALGAATIFWSMGAIFGGSALWSQFRNREGELSD